MLYRPSHEPAFFQPRHQQFRASGIAGGRFSGVKPLCGGSDGADTIGDFLITSGACDSGDKLFGFRHLQAAVQQRARHCHRRLIA